VGNHSGAGSGQNLANLFNLTGVTDMSDNETELWDTWIVGAPNFGVNTESTIYLYQPLNKSYLTTTMKQSPSLQVGDCFGGRTPSQ